MIPRQARNEAVEEACREASRTVEPIERLEPTKPSGLLELTAATLTLNLELLTAVRQSVALVRPRLLSHITSSNFDMSADLSLQRLLINEMCGSDILDGDADRLVEGYLARSGSSRFAARENLTDLAMDV